MATILDSAYPSLVNVAKRLRPQGGVETNIAELLSKLNDWLPDVPWMEGNLETGHQITERTGLPSPTKRQFNQGIQPSKSDTAQFIEGCALYEEHSNVDVDLAAASGNPAAFRASEDAAIVEGFSQAVASAIWYDSAFNVAGALHGLTPRYGATSGLKASANVLKPGTNSGTNCQSVWLVTWEPGRIFGVYPKGTVAGLKYQDKGEQRVIDPNGSNGAAFFAYVSRYVWKCGIAVQDWRYASRFQWDPDDTTNFADTAKTMYLTMQKMLATVYKLSPNARFYMSRTSYNTLLSQLASNTANFLEFVDSGGRRIPSFLGVPIRVTDALVAETAIS